ncbi:DUF4286 family protein [Agrobacterium bohemicum]|uniref:Uncharacterized protein n=1 Tax=Agrobacterium bohemicum TaxID=2052828 RepID=A0A135P0B1_9HYPH|nr:DUF4286 family protein [Agrobacterium bohemicum]KXG84872.1 hypothetical protein ATO67_09540 [Agrobacterium bohemicum]
MAAAILALWNDYPSKLAEEYEAWHTFEHVPERLTVPGMRAARRYLSSANSETYFTLYELEDLNVIEHHAYLDLVRNPTPWSLKMRRYFSSVLRIPGVVTSAGGNGIGGAALVQAYSVGRDEAHALACELEIVLQQLTEKARILGFRLALAAPNQIYDVFPQDEPTDPDTVDIVVIAEGSSVGALATLQNALTQKIMLMLQPRTCLRNDIFHMLTSYRGDEFPNHRSQLTVDEVSNIWVG